MVTDVFQVMTALAGLVFVCTTMVLARVMPDESLRLWRLSALLLGASILARIPGAYLLPEPWAVALSDLASTAGVFYVYFASRALFRRGLAGWWIPGAWCVAVAYAVLMVALGSPGVTRIVVSGLFGAVISFLAAWVFFTGRPPALLVATRVSGGILAMFGLVYLGRAIYGLTHRDLDLAEWTDNPLVLATYVLGTLVWVWLSALLVTLVAKRVQGEISEARAAAERSNEELLEMSWTDPRTGVATRSRIGAAMRAELDMLDATGMGLVVVLISVESVRSLTEERRHRAADAVMVAVAEGIRDELSRDRLRDHNLLDVVGRWSDDEYIVLLAHRSTRDGEQFARQLRSELAKSRREERPPIDCRYAVTEGHPGDDQTDVLARLDLALYRARDGAAHRIESV